MKQTFTLPLPPSFKTIIKSIEVIVTKAILNFSVKSEYVAKKKTFFNRTNYDSSWSCMSGVKKYYGKINGNRHLFRDLHGKIFQVDKATFRHF